MKSFLIKLGTVVPLAAMLIPVVIAFTLPGYSSVEQHIVEIPHPRSPTGVRFGHWLRPR